MKKAVAKRARRPNGLLQNGFPLAQSDANSMDYSDISIATESFDSTYTRQESPEISDDATVTTNEVYEEILSLFSYLFYPS